MSDQAYVLSAYAISLAMLWGYAASLWLTHRRLARRSAGPESSSPPCPDADQTQRDATGDPDPKH